MSDYEFGGEIALDPSDYVAGAGEAADASADLVNSTESVEGGLFDLDPAGIAAGGALAGVGTAAQGLLDQTRDMRESLDRTATTMGISSDEANELARSMTDVTFSHEDAAATMDLLARQGVDSTEEMETLALAADNVADATGASAAEIADNLGPAVRGLDGEIGALEDNQDAFTTALRNTTLEAGELGRVLEQNAGDLGEMGLGSDEAALAIAEFSEETGATGRELRRNFAEAVREADGDIDQFAAETGVALDEVEGLAGELEGSTEITDEHAAAVEDNASTMDRFRARMDDAQLAASEYIAPINAVAPAAQAAGIGVMALSTANTAALVPSIGAVTAALGPLLPLIVGTGAAMTAAAVVWKRDIGGIQGRTETGVGYITDSLEWLVDGLGWAIDTASYILFDWQPQDTLADTRDEIARPINDVREMIPSNTEEATELATNAFMNWHPAGIVYTKREEILDALPIPDEWRERGEALVSSFGDGIRDAIPDATGAAEDMAGRIGDYLPSSDAERGPLSNLESRGGAIPETLADGVRANSDDLENSIEEMASGAVRGLTIDDAEDGLDEAITDLEAEYDELTEGGVALEDQEAAAELSSQIDDLRDERDELADAESIADVDTELLAGVALEQAEEDEREAQALAEVEALVQDELSGAAPDGMIAGPDGPDPTTGDGPAADRETGSTNASASPGQEGDDGFPSVEELTKAVSDAIDQELEGRSMRMELDINQREFRGVVEDIVDVYLDG
ncbi:phage tail length tape measure family protein [Natrarchaeobaculum sulfurireducens]|uniref:Bacteriophage tail tape measure N-terminal domain-containing protein n=1 Tax=Natrarchaeobaculum sulfurireducens TaxID=2044521 RepID=A0A346PMN9_9EURY|nr:phage tail length tape measure family protein [Natrarchaeobaculum sulfurireducens]AXR80784.1 hypothetical protein AArcMg_0762 [Natrarchaeobaculum sulfurireducens]